MALFNKEYFHQGLDGNVGIKFRTGNFPKSYIFKDLFESQLFKLNSGDSATTDMAGHSRIETNARAINRSIEVGDGWTRFIQAHQLPNLYLTATGDHTAGTPVTNGNLVLTPLTYTYPDGKTRKDYLLQSLLSVISSDGSLTVTYNSTTGEYNIVVAGGVVDTYKIKHNAADTTIDYIENKIDDSLYVNVISNLLGVRLSDTNTIIMASGGSGIYANLKYITSSTLTISEGITGIYGDVKYDSVSLGVNSYGLYVKNYISNIISSDGSITATYNSTTKVWNLIANNILYSSGTLYKIQVSNGAGGFTHNNEFYCDTVNKSLTLGTRATGIENEYTFNLGTENYIGNKYAMAIGWNHHLQKGHLVLGQRSYNINGLFTIANSENTFEVSNNILITRGDCQTERLITKITDTVIGDPELKTGRILTIANMYLYKIKIDVICMHEGTEPAGFFHAIWAPIEVGIYCNVSGQAAFIDGVVHVAAKPSVHSLAPSTIEDNTVRVFIDNDREVHVECLCTTGKTKYVLDITTIETNMSEDM